jgi:hypothetical protein
MSQAFLGRTQLFKTTGPGGASAPFEPSDFRVGQSFGLNGRTFFVVDCDAKTRAWFRDNLGETVGPALPFPDDGLHSERATVEAGAGGRSGRAFQQVYASPAAAAAAAATAAAAAYAATLDGGSGAVGSDSPPYPGDSSSGGAVFQGNHRVNTVERLYDPTAEHLRVLRKGRKGPPLTRDRTVLHFTCAFTDDGEGAFVPSWTSR